MQRRIRRGDDHPPTDHDPGSGDYDRGDNDHDVFDHNHRAGSDWGPGVTATGPRATGAGDGCRVLG